MTAGGNKRAFSVCAVILCLRILCHELVSHLREKISNLLKCKILIIFKCLIVEI